MFQNISFGFLCALAFISWSLLCYLHAIEDHQKDVDYNVELYTERASHTDVPKDCPHKMAQTSFFNRFKEMLISYGLVLGITVALSRLFQCVELHTRSCLPYNSKALTAKKSQSFIEPINESVELVEQLWQLEQPPIPQQENVVLRDQLSDLQARCFELLQELRTIKGNGNGNDNSKDSIAADAVNATEVPINASTSSFTGVPLNASTSSFTGVPLSASTSSFSDSDTDDASGVIMWKQPATMQSSAISLMQCSEPPAATVTQNVYVTHSHIHFNFNGSVQLTEQNLNVGMLVPKNVHKRSEFLQVWGTYIKGPTERPMLTGINNILI